MKKLLLILLLLTAQPVNADSNSSGYVTQYGPAQQARFQAWNMSLKDNFKQYQGSRKYPSIIMINGDVCPNQCKTDLRPVVFNGVEYVLFEGKYLPVDDE